jgi:hypothetical protein
MTRKKRAESGKTEIGGSKGRRLQVRAARGSNKARPRRNGFTREKREILGHFAAACNATAAARAAGVAYTTVYAWRRKDEPFRRGWEEALDQGYARLEAEIVREAEEALRVRADEKAARQRMDPKTALAVLEAYRRNRGARPGDILPRASDAEQVRARIERKMRALRIIDADGKLIAPAKVPGRMKPPRRK